MATSPSHKLGELLGDFFESSIIEYLRPIITKKGYYLDYRHPRLARDNQREVIGKDNEGNKHKLDIVVEEGGSESVFGKPKAFIEMAWRRYKKHSKNKVQEIAGAIGPLVKTYAEEMPFYAAVLAGEFTDNAIKQLRSQGYYVLYFTYDEFCSCFDAANISICWEENTSKAELQKIISQLEKLSSDEWKTLKRDFFKLYSERLEKLSREICSSLDIVIAEVIIVPIHGVAQVLRSIEDAVSFIENYNESDVEPMLRYEIGIRYSNGDEYTMKCGDKRKAVQFLNRYL